MLQTRRDLARLVRQTYRRSQRRHASSTHPPGEPSGHAAAAGKNEPTHHGHHPEAVNESLGVRLPLTALAVKKSR